MASQQDPFITRAEELVLAVQELKMQTAALSFPLRLYSTVERHIETDSAIGKRK